MKWTVKLFLLIESRLTSAYASWVTWHKSRTL